MNPRRLSVLLIAIAGILAVSVAGHAFPTAVSVIDDGAIERPDVSDREAELLETRGGGEPEPDAEVSLPAEWFVIAVAVLGLGMLVRVALVRDVRRALLAVGAVVVLGALGVFAALWLWGGLSSIERTVPQSVSMGLAVVFFLVAVGLGSASYWRAGNRTGDSDAVVVGEAVSRSNHGGAGTGLHHESTAMDADVPADNDVYRAWLALREAVTDDVSFHSTSDEICRSAREAGLDAEVVDELRDLFEPLRYGTAEVNESDEQRARALLDRIEGEIDA